MNAVAPCEDRSGIRLLQLGILVAIAIVTLCIIVYLCASPQRLSFTAMSADGIYRCEVSGLKDEPYPRSEISVTDADGRVLQNGHWSETDIAYTSAEWKGHRLIVHGYLPTAETFQDESVVFTVTDGVVGKAILLNE